MPAALIAAAQEMERRLRRLRFSAPVAVTYHPLDYAWAMHEAYLRLAGAGRKRVVFLGMNPGPFGMVQTGVPFGEVAAVRDWMRLSAPIAAPATTHPRRPVDGLACRRSEVSGRRFWGLCARRFGSAPAFFADHFVANWCPLAFVVESGANLTPDKLPRAEREAVIAICDEHLRAVVAALKPRWLVGIGKFAATRAAEACADLADAPAITDIPHPSPANPAANRGWDGLTVTALEAQGIWPATQGPGVQVV